jgi:hypothetical protein
MTLDSVIDMAETSRQDLCARALVFADAIVSRYHRLAAGGPHHAHMALQLVEAAKWTQELAPFVQESGEFVAMLTVSVRKLQRE